MPALTRLQRKRNNKRRRDRIPSSAGPQTKPLLEQPRGAVAYESAKRAWKVRLDTLLGDNRREADKSSVCNTCKTGAHVTVHLVQTRSADEASTIFMVCSKCQQRWKI